MRKHPQQSQCSRAGRDDAALPRVIRRAPRADLDEEIWQAPRTQP